MNFFLEESFCPKDFYLALSFFKMHTEGAVLLNIKWREAAQAYGKSATGAGRIIGPLSGGSARTRDLSDLCKVFILFLKKKFSVVMAATRTLPPCRLNTGCALAPSLCD